MSDFTTKDIIRLALEDAIAWQQGLLDAHRHMPDDPEVPIIKAQLAAYRKVYKRRYPPRPDPLRDAKLVTLKELRKIKPTEEDHHGK